MRLRLITSKKHIIVGLVLLSILVAYCIGYNMAFPHGSRTAYLPIVVDALRAYADAHDGQFPNVEGDPYASLGALYPRYIGANYLAGLSGPRKQTVKALEEGKQLSETLCSWVYHPGLKVTDDPDIAIIWEREFGLAFNGKAIDGRAVGYVGRPFEQISREDWEAFEEEQRKLRESIFAKRGENVSEEHGEDVLPKTDGELDQL